VISVKGFSSSGPRNTSIDAMLSRLLTFIAIFARRLPLSVTGSSDGQLRGSALQGQVSNMTMGVLEQHVGDDNDLIREDVSDSKCGFLEGATCCTKPKLLVGPDGCRTGGNLDCVRGKCQHCGQTGEKCCDNRPGFGVGSDGCATSDNLDCVRDKCQHCGQEGEKCCDDKSDLGVGSDGCIKNVYCDQDGTCR